MRTGLTKQEKTTDIWFDEKDPLIHIRTHNTALKKRLLAYSRRYPAICQQTDADPETGCMEFDIEKGRFSFRLTAPYSEERRAVCQREQRRRQAEIECQPFLKMSRKFLNISTGNSGAFPFSGISYRYRGVSLLRRRALYGRAPSAASFTGMFSPTPSTLCSAQRIRPHPRSIMPVRSSSNLTALCHRFVQTCPG